MTYNPISTFDAYLSLLGAIGLYPSLRRLVKEERLNPQERSLKWITLFMAGLFLVRFPYLAYGMRFFGALTYVCAILLAFSIFIYFESLMRRHMPLFLKVFMTIGSLYYAYLAVFDELAGKREALIGFGSFLCLSQLFVLFVCLLRKRRDHSPIENHLIDLSLVSLTLLTPLFLTDVTTYGFKMLPRMGVVGGLIFAYTSMYNQSVVRNRGYLVLRLATSLLLAVFLTFVLTYLVEHANEIFWYRSIVLFFVVSMFYRIISGNKELDGDQDQSHFIESLSLADKSSVDKFFRTLNLRYRFFDKKLLKQSELIQHTPSKMISLFEKTHSPVISVYDLRALISEGIHKNEWTGDLIDGGEQMVELLESHSMTHICKFGNNNVYFLLIHIPFVGYAKMIYRMCLLIDETVKLIEKKTV